MMSSKFFKFALSGTSLILMTTLAHGTDNPSVYASVYGADKPSPYIYYADAPSKMAPSHSPLSLSEQVKQLEIELNDLHFEQERLKRDLKFAHADQIAARAEFDQASHTSKTSEVLEVLSKTRFAAHQEKISRKMTAWSRADQKEKALAQSIDANSKKLVSLRAELDEKKKKLTLLEAVQAASTPPRTTRTASATGQSASVPEHALTGQAKQFKTIPMPLVAQAQDSSSTDSAGASANVADIDPANPAPGIAQQIAEQAPSARLAEPIDGLVQNMTVNAPTARLESAQPTVVVSADHLSSTRSPGVRDLTQNVMAPFAAWQKLCVENGTVKTGVQKPAEPVPGLYFHAIDCDTGLAAKSADEIARDARDAQAGRLEPKTLRQAIALHAAYLDQLRSDHAAGKETNFTQFKRFFLMGAQSPAAKLKAEQIQNASPAQLQAEVEKLRVATRLPAVQPSCAGLHFSSEDLSGFSVSPDASKDGLGADDMMAQISDTLSSGRSCEEKKAAIQATFAKSLTGKSLEDIEWINWSAKHLDQVTANAELRDAIGASRELANGGSLTASRFNRSPYLPEAALTLRNNMHTLNAGIAGQNDIDIYHSPDPVLALASLDASHRTGAIDMSDLFMSKIVSQSDVRTAGSTWLGRICKDRLESSKSLGFEDKFCL